jgi:hypothetical protein
MITMKDVAARAGVSTMTVSNVMNHTTKVAPTFASASYELLRTSSISLARLPEACGPSPHTPLG